MKDKIKTLIPIIIFSLLPTLLIWLPFYLRVESLWKIPLPKEGMATVVSNYDGPLYIVVAKTFYNPELIKDSFPFDLPVEYYAAHFPLYPILIRLTSFITGFPYASLMVTLLSSFLCLYFFNRLVSKHTQSKDTLYLTFLFAIFPARWLIVRSVGSPEPLFIAALLASIDNFGQKKYWRAGFWGAIAQLTKSAGILLFVAYSLLILAPKFQKLVAAGVHKWGKIVAFNSYPVLLIPASLLLVFTAFKYTLGDFLAYFHSGDNIHLFFPPFQVFNYRAPWVNTHWLEEIIFIYLIITLALTKLIDQKQHLFASFTAVFLISIFFVSHRDVMRYALPVIPFVIIAFSDILVKREFKLALAVIIIPIYLFSLVFISQNAMPISNWSPLL